MGSFFVFSQGLNHLVLELSLTKHSEFEKQKHFLSFVVPQNIPGLGSVFRSIGFGVVSYVVLNHF